MSEGATEKNIFIETLEWICHKLKLANIPYMVTGGAAVGFWGHIRTTMDIDIVAQIPAEAVNPFLKSIEDEAYVDIETAKRAILKREMFNIISNKTCFKVDIIPLKEDIYEIEKFSNKIKLNLKGKEIFVISPEDLIISKLLWCNLAGDSERQFGDCESIYRLNYENLDLNYIKRWTMILNVKDKFDKLGCLQQRHPS